MNYKILNYKNRKMEKIKVYTDGACSNNGKDNAKAGIGVYFSKNDKRNISERVGGKQTNNVAELEAIIKAILILYSDIKEGKEIEIYTDSKYSKLCCTTYGEKLYKNNWKSKKPIPNIELVKKVYFYFNKYNNIKIQYIRAHTGLTDEDSKGNFEADRLAVLSLRNG